MMTILAAVLAISIASDKIDSFMHLPDWFPTAVDAEHTFGSDEHTNCTHRTTLDTLAAVESVFEAYHERVFYASDAFSPDWDRSVYGPKPAEGLQNVWFTNTLESAPGCFVYSSWTNTLPRAVPESRRLLEFTNVFALAKWIPRLFGMRTGSPWLDKGEAWGTNRTVMFASSWGPGEKLVPDDVPWTEGRPLSSDDVDFDSMIPLCYCTNDTVFVTSDFQGKEYGLTYRMLSDVDRTFNVLGYAVTNSAGETVRRGGILGGWRTRGFSNSLARATSVPGIVTNHFPGAGPEAGMTNFTRRLVPDDYTVYVTRTSYYERVASFEVDIDLYWNRPNDTERSLAERETFYYRNIAGFEVHGDGSILVEFESDPSIPRGTIERMTGAAYVTQKLAEYDRVSLTLDIGSAPGGDWAISYRYPYEPDCGVWYWFDRYASVTVDCWKYHAETTTVENASSLLATESRALAMLDRTYEIGPFLVTNGPRKAEVTRYRADLRSEDDVTVSIANFEGFPFVDVVPVTLSDIGTGLPVYQTSNSVEDVTEDAPFSREFARFSGESAGGAIIFDGQANYVSVPSVTASDVNARLSGVRWSPGRYEIEWGDALFIPMGTDLYVESRCTVPGLPVEMMLFSDEHGSAIKESLKTRVRVSVTKSAWYAVGDRLTREFYERRLSRVAPGPRGFSDGLVGSCKVEFFSGSLFMRSYVDQEEGPMDSLWFPDMGCASLPGARPEDDEQLSHHPPVPFVFEPSFRVHGSAAGAYGSIPGLLYAARDDVRSRAIIRLSSAVVGSWGSMSSAEDVVQIRSLDSVFTPLYADRAGIGAEPLARQDTAVEIRDAGSDPVVIDTGTGNALPGDAPVYTIRYGIDILPTVSPRIDRAKLHPAVAVDGRVEPVVITDWNWKSLKSERVNQ